MKIMQSSIEGIVHWAAKFPTIEVTGFVKRWPLTGLELVVPMQNASRTPATDYAWHPQEMADHWARMDREGAEPVAFYHSHPGGRSEPSEVDMAAALQVGMVYLIAYPEMTKITSWAQVDPLVQLRHWQVTAWLCIEMGILIQEPLEVVS